MIKIERGIPMPTAPRGYGDRGNLSETLRSMKKGESFLIPLARTNSVRSTAARVGVKVSIRREDGKEVRVWKAS